MQRLRGFCRLPQHLRNQLPVTYMCMLSTTQQIYGRGSAAEGPSYLRRKLENATCFLFAGCSHCQVLLELLSKTATVWEWWIVAVLHGDSVEGIGRGRRLELLRMVQGEALIQHHGPEYCMYLLALDSISARAMHSPNLDKPTAHGCFVHLMTSTSQGSYPHCADHALPAIQPMLVLPRCRKCTRASSKCCLVMLQQILTSNKREASSGREVFQALCSLLAQLFGGAYALVRSVAQVRPDCHAFWHRFLSSCLIALVNRVQLKKACNFAASLPQLVDRPS